ncbi:hypothetical protein Tco_0929642, partial [Tanacetum coccineum]
MRNNGYEKIVSKMAYQAKNKSKEESIKTLNKAPVKEVNVEENKGIGESYNGKKQWTVHDDVLAAIKRNMEVVDEFLNKKVVASNEEMSGWNIDMMAYLKSKSEVLVDKGSKVDHIVVEEEDVLSDVTGIPQCMEGNVVEGMDKGEINENVIHMASQSVLLRVETISGHLKILGSFIYVGNGGNERKELWKDLKIYKRIVGIEPWFFFGDMNVILAHKEHYMGGSSMTKDMIKFKKCIN